MVRSGKMPTPLVKSFWGVALGRTLIAGTRLGVFEVLSKGEKTAEEVAQDTGCNPEGVETLLNALNGFGYLKRRNGRYSITKQTAKWLTESSSSSIRDAIMFLFELWNDFRTLREQLRAVKSKTSIFVIDHQSFGNTIFVVLQHLHTIMDRKLLERYLRLKNQGGSWMLEVGMVCTV